MAIDPVCGMEVNQNNAEFTAKHEGKDFYFCSEQCKRDFQNNPEQYVRGAA